MGRVEEGGGVRVLLPFRWVDVTHSSDEGGELGGRPVWVGGWVGGWFE